MKATVRELLDALGVDRDLGPYDTVPWSAYDPEKGLTCQADVRMGSNGDDIEAEIQFIYDEAPADTPPVEQIFFLHAKLTMNQKWTPDQVRIRNESYNGKVYDWEKKGCEFFLACSVQLARNVIPDIDELIERIFKAAENFGTGTASGGGRKPMIRPEQLLDPSKKF